MRLPADAVLMVVDMQMAIDDPRWGALNNAGAEAQIAALLAAWREVGLPVLHIRHDSPEPASPYRADAPGHAFKPCAAPIKGEPVFAKQTTSAFADGRLDAALTKIGVTALVLCGVLTQNSVEATARSAGDLGYRVFVAADACRASAKTDATGRRWSAEEVHALACANLAGEYARIVDVGTAVMAARLAAAIRDRRAAKAR
ncbi:MAG: cysteine hydrolase [Methylobacteriaceae bacterium]|nr:cysteine hydrolase [Methylobacteriaceae bacterium]